MKVQDPPNIVSESLDNSRDTVNAWARGSIEPTILENSYLQTASASSQFQFKVQDYQVKKGKPRKVKQRGSDIPSSYDQTFNSQKHFLTQVSQEDAVTADNVGQENQESAPNESKIHKKSQSALIGEVAEP